MPAFFSHRSSSGLVTMFTFSTPGFPYDAHATHDEPVGHGLSALRKTSLLGLFAKRSWMAALRSFMASFFVLSKISRSLVMVTTCASSFEGRGFVVTLGRSMGNSLLHHGCGDHEYDQQHEHDIDEGDDVYLGRGTLRWS